MLQTEAVYRRGLHLCQFCVIFEDSQGVLDLTGVVAAYDRRIFSLKTDRPDDIEFSLYDHLPGYGANLPYMLSAYLKHEKHPKPDKTEYQRYYSRIYRKLRELAGLNLITLKKHQDSLWWAEPTNRALNLMQGMQNSNPEKTEDFGVWKFPRNCRPERKQALQILLKFKMLDQGSIDDVQNYFEIYLEDINERVVLLKFKEDEGNPDAIPLQLPYKTRFNDDGRKVEKLKEFEGIWDYATTKYQNAVFLTLTTDPKRFKSAYHANRHFSTAMNRYFSLLRKRFGYRVPYLAVYEFTKKGLLHAHIAFFGISYLDHYKGISADWQRCGQGQIIHVYGLRNDAGKWVWQRQRPKDSKKGESAEDYLKKYLRKSLYSIEGQELYWAFNKRHFTNSRVLSVDKPPKPPALNAFFFVGSCHIDQVPLMVQDHNEKVIRQLIAAAHRKIPDDFT